jgi:hypothetical protein
MAAEPLGHPGVCGIDLVTVGPAVDARKRQEPEISRSEHDYLVSRRQIGLGLGSEHDLTVDRPLPRCPGYGAPVSPKRCSNVEPVGARYSVA